MALTSRIAALFDANARHDPTAAVVVPATVPTKEARRFAMFTILTAVVILVQAFVAGMFVNQEGRDGWVTVHGVVADVSWVVALVSAIVAWVTMRAYRRSLVMWSVILWLATLLEAGMGHLIATDDYNWMIPIHVPLAFGVFALTLWLTTRALALRQKSPAAA